MRLTLAAAVILAGALASCSVASGVSSQATERHPSNANVCGNGDPKHPFFALRSFGYCAAPAVRT